MEETGRTPVCWYPAELYLVIIRWASERVKPRQQLHLAFPAWRLGGPGSPIYFFQSLAFGFNISSRVDVGRIETFMSKPAANHRHVNLCRDKTHRRGVPESMRGDAFAE